MINLNPRILSASNKGEVPFLFTYVAMLIPALLVLVVLLNLNFPKYKFEEEFYSCVLNSYEGKINCSFPYEIHAKGKGENLKINDKSFVFDGNLNFDCKSSRFIILRGELKCGTS